MRTEQLSAYREADRSVRRTSASGIARGAGGQEGRRNERMLSYLATRPTYEAITLCVRDVLVRFGQIATASEPLENPLRRTARSYDGSR